MASIEERIRWAWPDAVSTDIIQVGPLGSRTANNVLLFNRRTNEVVTGVRMAGTKDEGSCFRGTLPAFADAVEARYNWLLTDLCSGDKVRYERLRAEYRCVILMLASLPPLP